MTFSNEMRYKELTFFLTQLSTYIKSGITLADTIAILEKQTNKKKNKELFKRISYELNTGSNFSEALARQGNVFEICNQVDSFIAEYLTESIVIGTSYDMLEAHHGILPISRNCFYRRRRIVRKIMEKRMGRIVEEKNGQLRLATSL